MSSPVVLMPFDPEADVVIRTDASDHSVGGVLWQPSKIGGIALFADEDVRYMPVDFTSRQFPDKTRCWGSGQREATAVVYVFRSFARYCAAARNPPIFVTDHKHLVLGLRKPGKFLYRWIATEVPRGTTVVHACRWIRARGRGWVVAFSRY